MESLNGLEPLTQTQVSIETRSNTALNLANQLAVDSPERRVQAGDFLKLVKRLQEEVKKDREDEYRQAKALADTIAAARKRHLWPLEQAEKVIKGKVLAFEEAEAAKLKAEQDEINRRLQQEAEEKAIADAIALQEAGAHELAEEVLEQAETQEIAPVILPKTAPRVDGQHVTVNWKCRLKDLRALVVAIASGEQSLDLVQFNQVRANQEIREIKSVLSKIAPETGTRISRDGTTIDEINKLPNGTVLTPELIGHEIPGVEIYTDKSMASRSY